MAKNTVPESATVPVRKTRRKANRIAVFPSADGSGKREYVAESAVEIVTVPNWLGNENITAWLDQGLPAVQSAFNAA